MNTFELSAEDFKPRRLQKLLAEQGLCSRREADRLIGLGRVEVDGKIASAGMVVQRMPKTLKVDGKLLDLRKAPPKVYLILNKPEQTLVSLRAEEKKSTIFDLPDLKRIPYPVSPVGRLDFLSEGMLILSNDGELVHRLTHPKYKIPRTYRVLINKKLSRSEFLKITSGVTLEDGPVSDIRLRHVTHAKIGGGLSHWYDIVVSEGRNRLVRRIFGHFDIKVLRLVRTAYGDVQLPESLRSSKIQQLTHEQVSYLKKSVEMF